MLKTGFSFPIRQVKLCPGYSTVLTWLKVSRANTRLLLAPKILVLRNHQHWQCFEERTTPRTTALVARDLSGCQLQVGWSHRPQFLWQPPDEWPAMLISFPAAAEGELKQPTVCSAISMLHLLNMVLTPGFYCKLLALYGHGVGL